MNGDITTVYPLEAGLRDIIRYYDAGTLTSGLANLSSTLGKNKIDKKNVPVSPDQNK